MAKSLLPETLSFQKLESVGAISSGHSNLKSVSYSQASALTSMSN